MGNLQFLLAHIDGKALHRGDVTQIDQITAVTADKIIVFQFFFYLFQRSVGIKFPAHGVIDDPVLHDLYVPYFGGIQCHGPVIYGNGDLDPLHVADMVEHALQF